MRKLGIAIIVMSISMILAGCNNSETQNNQNMTNKKITVDEAKEIALKHANLTSDQVSFIREDIEVDDGVEKYNIEFYHQNKEYDYEINATDGNIIEYDYDVENYNIPKGEAISKIETKITVDEAKEIALKHANLTSEKVTFGKLELDFDDGIQKYDIEFYYNNKEYGYEIDANTGNVLAYEQD